MAAGADHTARRDELTAERLRISDELAELKKRWEAERAIVTEIDAVRGKHRCRGRRSSAAGARKRRRKQRRPGRSRQAGGAVRRACARCRANSRSIFPMVDGQAIAEIVEAWTGIPARRMQSDEIRTVLNLREVHGAPRHRPKPCHGSRRAGASAPAGPA